MYTEDDAAYDAYVAEHGEPADALDAEHELHRPVLTVTMVRHHETVEIRVYREPRMLTFTYPPVIVQGSPIDAFGIVREVPYGERQDGAALLLKFIADFEAGSWVRTGAA